MTNKNLPPTIYNLQPNRGFAMLFSVLISSLLVVIGLSIFNLTLKELTISTAARESQAAFYAAHAGLECALYWDNPYGKDTSGDGIDGDPTAFARSGDSSGSSAEDTRVGLITANCNEVDVNNNYSTPIPPGGTTITTATFFVTSLSDGPCVTIEVSKTPDPLVPGKITTTIESQGRNICGTSGRKVERGLSADYEI